VHNGIEHGMMSAISEAWGIRRAMEIGDVLSRYNEEGAFKGKLLVAIGVIWRMNAIRRTTCCRVPVCMRFIIVCCF
jgi:6-phosphogluconate dehydrogenase (decarboxylating)